MALDRARQAAVGPNERSAATYWEEHHPQLTGVRSTAEPEERNCYNLGISMIGIAPCPPHE